MGARLKARARRCTGFRSASSRKRAGVTNGLISLIEQNRVSPSVGSLKKVLDGVPMSLAEFFTLDLAGTAQVFYGTDELVELGDGGRLAATGRSAAARPAAHDPARALRAGRRHRRSTCCGIAGEEGGVVVRGKVELTVGGQTRVLGPGRRLLFRERDAAPLPQSRARAL